MEIKDQPAPDGGWGNVQALVRADLEERERIGVERYGTPLRIFNGRDALVDAYQEALDLVCYLRQHLAEQEALETADDPVPHKAMAAAERAAHGAEDVIAAVHKAVFAAAPFIAAAAVRDRDDSPPRSEASPKPPVAVYRCANPTCRFVGVMVEVPVSQIGHFLVCPELRCRCGFEPSVCSVTAPTWEGGTDG